MPEGDDATRPLIGEDAHLDSPASFGGYDTNMRRSYNTLPVERPGAGGFSSSFNQSSFAPQASPSPENLSSGHFLNDRQNTAARLGSGLERQLSTLSRASVHETVEERERSNKIRDLFEDDDGGEWWGQDEEGDEQVVRDLEQLRNELEETQLEVEQSDVDTWRRFQRETANINTRLPIEQASLYVKDCLTGDHLPFLNKHIYWYTQYRSEAFRRVLKWCCILNIVLAMCQIHMEDVNGVAPSQHKVLHYMVIPVELVCLVVFIAQSFMQWRFMGWRAYLRNPMCVILALSTCLYFFDLLIYPFFHKAIPFTEQTPESNRKLLRFYITPIYAFFYFTMLRETLPNITRSAWALIPVVLFIFMLLIIFAIYGFMLFFKRNSYFSSFGWALYQMLITLTTANFPDVMVQGFSHPYTVVSDQHPSYFNHTSEQWVTVTVVTVQNNTDNQYEFALTWYALSYYMSPLFFIIFYLIGMYFLMSVAFAVVYGVYKDNLKKQVLGKYSYRMRMLGRAFQCLMHYKDDGYDTVNRTKTMLQKACNKKKNEPKDSAVTVGAVGEINGGSTSPAGPAAPAGFDSIINGLRERTQSIVDQKDLAPSGQAGSQPRQRTRGVDLYLFGILYDELFPSKRPSNLNSEIETGSTVGLLADVTLDTNKVLKKGLTGIVIAPASDSQAFYEVDFSGVVYMASKEEIVGVAPNGSRERTIRVLFHAMDFYTNGVLDTKEFRALFQLLQLKVKIVRDSRLFLERVLPTKVFQSKFVTSYIRFGRGKWLRRVVSIWIIFTVVLMTVHFEYIASESKQQNTEYLTDTWLRFMYAEVLAGLVFDIECFFKVTCTRWTVYWRKKWNRFDFMTTMLNICIYVSLIAFSWYFGERKAMAMVMELQTDVKHKSEDTPDLIMIVLLFRLIRLFRIVTEYNQFRYILKTFANILPIFMAYISACFIVYFYFASLGMLLFKNAEVPTSTSYSQSDYYALNFNSFYSSCVTLWCIMIVNNWFVIVDGFRAACGNWAVAYFVAFWLASVILLMNVVTALVVEVWGSQWELNKEKAVNIDKNPLAQRILALNHLTPEDGDKYYQLGLPPDPDGGRPRYEVSYRNYSNKVNLALECLFLHQNGFQHVIV